MSMMTFGIIKRDAIVMLALGIKFGLIGVKPRIYPGPLVVITWLS